MKTMFVILVLVFTLTTQVFSIGIKTPPNIEELADIIYTRGFALIIGVQDYTPSEFQREYAKSDVDSVAKLITSKYGFNADNVTTLKNKDATKQNIMAKINALAEPKKLSAEDCLLIYFCGQGVTFTNEKGDYGFLVPYNMDFDLSKEKTYKEYKDNCISIYEIQKALKDVSARHIIIITDACLGGVLIKNVKSTGSTISSRIMKISACKAFQVLMAGQKGEKPIDNQDANHGIFTYNILKALEDKKADENKDNLIEGTELANYIKDNVLKVTDGKQTPKFIKTGDGEFLFVPQTIRNKE